MKKIVLYTINKCPHCETAKKYLDKQNIVYRLCNVQTPKGQKEFAKLHLRGLPVLKVGDQILNGFSALKFNQLL
jgi:glutaredoxin